LSLSNAFQQTRVTSQLSNNGFLSPEHAQQALGAEPQESTGMQS
jgi:hypothetical protein